MSPLERYYQAQVERNHRAIVLWFSGDSYADEMLSEQLGESRQDVTYGNLPSTEIVLSLIEEKAALRLEASPHFRTQLGEEHGFAFADFTKEWHADIWTALTGTLVGGGLLIIRLDAHSFKLASRHHLLSFFQPAECFHCRQDQALIDFLAHWTPPRIVTEFCPSYEQQAVLQHIDALAPHQALMLNAARGRGKTATLNYWLRQRLETKASCTERVFISAPSKKQASLYPLTHPQVEFLAPDQLASQTWQTTDILLIDEAATLPVQAQNTILQFPGRLILATTTEGYEYAGRGFRIRFETELRQHFQTLFRVTLQAPIRWSAGDALERVNREAFALYSVETTSLHAYADNQASNYTEQSAFEFEHARAADLTAAERSVVFQLLSDAHYQTRPSDFQLLLDDRSQHILQLRIGGKMLGVAWIAEEGPLIDDLIEPIQRGKRRPPGNLLPQAYAYYAKAPELARMRHARIVRIAVQDGYRHIGLGSALIYAVTQWATQRGFDALGTSFGMTEALATFWSRNQWFPVRIGHKADPASRYPSVIYAYPLSPRSIQPLKRLASLLMSELRYRTLGARGPWQNLDTEFALFLRRQTAISPATEAQVKARWQEFGTAFAMGELNFLDYKPWLQAALQHHWCALTSEQEQQLIQCAIDDAGDLSGLAVALNLAGKKQALNSLREVCLRLHQAV